MMTDYYTKATTKSYDEVQEDYYKCAERIGLHSNDPEHAWLDLNGVWWPNPHYTGEEVIHPELKKD